MALIVLLRGPSAVGKTTIANELLLKLKKENLVNCAFISEDNFRKQMQFKYKAADKRAHINSGVIIFDVINRLLELDNYEVIIIDGLFRYKETIDEYIKFCSKNNYEFLLFQLHAPREIRQKRDKAGGIRDHYVGLNEKPKIFNGEEEHYKYSKVIDTTKTIKESTSQIIHYIMKGRFVK